MRHEQHRTDHHGVDHYGVVHHGGHQHDGDNHGVAEGTGHTYQAVRSLAVYSPILGKTHHHLTECHHLIQSQVHPDIDGKVHQ